jgi:NTP pyrophosphatase (non-canonical NTP hydrolase)
MHPVIHFDAYQNKAATFATYPQDKAIVYLALGLNGEAGEVAEKIKKVIRDNNGEFSEDKIKEILLELGDNLWYISEMARQLGFDLSFVAECNINKLKSRLDRDKLHGSGDHR